MSSSRDDQLPSSSQFHAPQSAQPVRSLFGGPNSDGPRSSPEPASEPPNEPTSEAAESDAEPDEAQEVGNRPVTGDRDLDLILSELPLIESDSGDENYLNSDSDDEGKRKVERRQTRSGRSSEAPTDASDDLRTDEIEPLVYYSLDRGNDFSDNPERPNRWTGLPSAYYRAIAQERSVYDGLTLDRSRNLSNHLYNAFFLRRPPKKSRKDPSQADDDDDEDVAKFGKRWVAWPMPALVVPSPSESLYRKQAELGIYGRPPDFRPSADLEDSIIASMMSTAHQQFKAREWDTDGLKSNPEIRDPDPNEMVISDDENDKKADDADSAFLRPGIQSDDDISRQQLLPLSRNVITHVDKLLMGLHHSIRNRVDNFDSSDDSATDEDGASFSRSRGKGKGKKKAPARGSKRARKESFSEKEYNSRAKQIRPSPLQGSDQEMADIDGAEEAAEEDENDARPVILDRMALRDWSEVMGIASIIGLPADAVKRASRRCADLFNQDMRFRVLHEGHVEPVGQLTSTTMNYAYVENEVQGDASSTQKTPNSRAPPKKANASQLKKARSTILALSQHPDSQPQSQQAGLSASSFPTPSGATALPEFPTPIVPVTDQGPDGHHCPIPSCDKHKHRFPRIWNLKLHLERMHPEYYETVKESLVIRNRKKK